MIIMVAMTILFNMMMILRMMEMARRRSWILCNARTRAVCSSAWNCWGPGFSPFQKVVRAIADILVNRVNFGECEYFKIFQRLSGSFFNRWHHLSIVAIFADMWISLTSLSLLRKIVSPVDGTTIWIVTMIFSQRSSEDLLWAQRLRT